MAVTTTMMRLAAVQQQPVVTTTRRGSRAAAGTTRVPMLCRPRTGAGRSSASIPGSSTTYQRARIALVTRASASAPSPPPEEKQQSGVPQPQITVLQPPMQNIHEAWPKEHQGYLWSLEVDRTWCKESRDREKLCEFLVPLMLTNAIDTHRTGPNQTGEMFVGRDESQCDIKLFDAPYMSERHACFEEDGDTGHLFVTDLKSVNGTFVNGEQLEANMKTELHPGDKISFGKLIAPQFVVHRDIKAHA